MNSNIKTAIFFTKTNIGVDKNKNMYYNTKRYNLKRIMKLNEIENGKKGIITSINGNNKFATRFASVGILPGSEIEIVKNYKKQPVLLCVKNTLMAIGRKQCEQIEAEVVL